MRNDPRPEEKKMPMRQKHIYTINRVIYTRSVLTFPAIGRQRPYLFNSCHVLLSSNPAAAGVQQQLVLE